MDHRKVLRQQILAQNNLHLRAEPGCQRLKLCLQFSRAHVLRRGVDQIAGQKFTLGHRQNQPVIHNTGHFEQGWGRGLSCWTIAVKPVLTQQRRKRRFGRLGRGQRAFQMPGPARQSRHRFGQMEPPARPGLRRAGPGHRRYHRAIRTGDQPHFTRPGFKPGLNQPTRRSLGQCGLPLRQPLGGNQGQRARWRIFGGKFGGHGNPASRGFSAA